MKDTLLGVPAYASTVGVVGKVNDYLSVAAPALHSTGQDVASLKGRLVRTSNYNAGWWALGNSSLLRLNG